jgi:hypothetical protein
VFDELSGLISPDNSYKLLREMQREAWKENFNKAERYTVRLGSDDATAGGDAKRRTSSSSSSTEGIYGLIPYIAIYIIDLEHLSQVPETMANGMVNFAKKKIEVRRRSSRCRVVHAWCACVTPPMQPRLPSCIVVVYVSYGRRRSSPR